MENTHKIRNPWKRYAFLLFVAIPVCILFVPVYLFLWVAQELGSEP